jgi:hypothetical protein
MNTVTKFPTPLIIVNLMIDGYFEVFIMIFDIDFVKVQVW